MTPAAQYAQKREEAIALIRQHAPQRVQDALIDLLRPAIALSATKAEDAQIPLGASKFGGAPDVPAGFEWPMWNEKPLGFLAQINLEEIAEFTEDLLPKSGLLSFFFNWEDWSGTGEDMCRILWIDSSELSRANFTGESRVAVSCGRFSGSFHFDIQIPYSFASDLLDEDEFANLNALVALPNGPLAYRPPLTHRNKMLGYGEDPSCVFPISSPYYPADHQPWHLLLELWLPDFLDAGQDFGEAFVLYFPISPDDLRERHFQKSRFEVENT